MRRRRGRKWIEAEIAGLDPATDTERIMLLSTNRMLPRLGRGAVMNLLYTLGFLRVSGQIEGAQVVDAIGKVHRAPDRRADDTIGHFALWLAQGPNSERGRASLEEVRGIHDSVGERFAFSNETMVHTICLFTVQFQLLLDLIGIDGYNQVEKEAQVAHWLAIGDQLGTREMPQSWEEMIEFLRSYEASPSRFGPSPEGKRCAQALVGQFAKRWLPPGARWAAQPLLASLLEAQVVEVVGLWRPPQVVAVAIRGGLRAGLTAERRLLSEPRELVDPSLLTPSRATER